MMTAPTATANAPLLATSKRVVPWALCAGVAGLPVLSFLLASRPLVQQLLVAAVLALSAARGGRGWLACAILVPIGVPLGHWTGSETSLGEPIVLAFLAGWLVHESLRRIRSSGVSADSGGPLVPAALFAIAVLASSAVRLIVFRLWVDFPLAYIGGLFGFFWHDYFGGTSGLAAPVTQGSFVLEGVGLFMATAILTTRDRRLAERGVVAVALTGAAAAGVTAAPFLVQLVRGGWAAALPGGLLALRTAIVSADVNAAGSYYLIPLGAAVGLALASTGGRRGCWTLVAGLSLCGLWVTGSRAALVAAPAAAFAVGLPAAATRGRAAVKAVGPLIVALAVVAAGYLLLTAHVRTALGPAIQWRTENGATALRMFADHPAFGVGVGRFFELSHAYASPEWRTVVPAENAHNNFLQVLAELGVVGLGLLLWLIASVVRPAWTRAVRGGNQVLLALTGGIVGFVITWLAGHPLLQREVSLSFWLALGLMVGLTAASSPLQEPMAQASPRVRRMALAAGLLIVASVFPRVSAETSRADLRDAGRALSNWKVDKAGQRFRWMANRAAVFAPTGGQQVALPFRSPNGTATIKLLVSGRVVGRAVADGTAWRDAVVRLPADGVGRFQEVEIRATIESCRPPADCRVQVGIPRIVD